MPSDGWRFPVSCFARQEMRELMHLITPRKQKAALNGVFSDWVWTFDPQRPSEQLRQTVAWATTMTEELERSGLKHADEVFTANLAKLLSTALSRQERLTSIHLLMDSLTVELIQTCVIENVLQHIVYVTPITEDSVYDDQPSAKAVERYDELMTIIAQESPEVKLDSARALLAELDLRVTLEEHS